MRKLLCGIALGAFLALTMNYASAQTAETAPAPPPGGWHHGPPDPTEQAAHMAKRLNLSTEQQTQVAALLTSAQAEHKALEENQSITHQQFLAQSKALHEQTESKIEALLNDTQKAEFAQMKAHMRRGPGPDGEGAPPPPEQ
jgi:Spy/CpxP family protein refolding chaperone